MKGLIEDIREHFKGRWSIIVLLTLGSLFCMIYAANGDLPLAAIVCAVPFVLILIGFFIKKPVILFVILFIVNYGIMGLGRYVAIPIPISVAMDGLLLSTLFVFRQDATDI